MAIITAVLVWLYDWNQKEKVFTQEQRILLFEQKIADLKEIINKFETVDSSFKEDVSKSSSQDNFQQNTECKNIATTIKNSERVASYGNSYHGFDCIEKIENSKDFYFQGNKATT